MTHRTLARALVCCSLLAACTAGDAAPPPERGVRIGMILPTGSAVEGARRGAELGALEATRAGELFDFTFDLRIEEATSPREIRRAARRLVRSGATGIVGGFDLRGCRELMRVAEELQIVFMNVGCREEELRESPGSTTFHVEASRWMYDDARTADAVAEEGGEPALWDAALVRFGAAQLNDRFERQFGEPADARGWAGWMAVKVLWESTLRTRSREAAVLKRYILDENTSFDGHKGQALAFDAAAHQLRQPLYLPVLRQGARVPVEIDPLSGASAGMSSGEWIGMEGRGVPAGAYVLISNEGSGDVTVIDLATREVVSRIRVGSRPRGIRVAPDARLVYVALSDDAPTIETDDDGIAVIDLRTGRVIHQHPAGTDPEAFDLSPDGRFLYASNEDAGTATITDLETGDVLATLPVGIEPEGVATSPDGRWVYVTAETSNTVSVIDTRVNEVVASFLVDVRPRAAVFSPDRPRAYVTNEISATVSVVDTDTHTVVEVIDLPDATSTPVGVAVSPDGSRIFVANGHANSVSVIDTDSKQVLADIPVGRRPWGIDITPDGRFVFTANGLTNDVSVIDTGSLTVVETIRVGQRPWGVAVTR